MCQRLGTALIPNFTIFVFLPEFEDRGATEYHYYTISSHKYIVCVTQLWAPNQHSTTCFKNIIHLKSKKHNKIPTPQTYPCYFLPKYYYSTCCDSRARGRAEQKRVRYFLKIKLVNATVFSLTCSFLFFILVLIWYT